MPTPKIYDEMVPDVGGAIIGYQSSIDTFIDTASTEPAAAALIPNTYDQVSLPSSGTTQRIAFEILEDSYINYIGISGHNTRSKSYRIDVTKSISPIPGTDYIAQFIPESDRPILEEVTPFTAANNQLVIFSWSSADSNINDQDIYVGNVFVGEYLQMPVPIFVGQDIPNYADNAERETVFSEYGEFIGRNTVRMGNKATFTFRHVSIAWYRQKFLPFVEHARTKPFFLKWRPDRFNTETVFGYVENDITAMITNGASGLMTITFTMSMENDV